jgi:putative transposase
MDSKNRKTEEIKTQLRDLIKQTLQEALEGELEEYLGYPKNKPPKDKSTKPSNVRNGYSTKTVKSDSGEVELEVPRDRNSEFEPQIVKKRQSILDDLEDKIVALYSKGMTTRDIQDILEDVYGVELSPSLISRLTDRMLPRLEEWQCRPLGEAYAVIWLDCIFYKVREEGKVLSKAIYLVIGLGLDGMKEILGFWVSAKESSGFWLGVLNDLKSRGVRDVFIFSVDGLNGLEEAIAATYPASDIQRCVIHQIRNTLRYVSWKDKKELSKDLKTVYGASTLEGAGSSMDEFEKKWGSKYPHIIKSWRERWESLMTYFRYPVEIRKLVYTTNLIESVNSKFRKVTDAKRVFPSDSSVLKSLFMAARDLERKWTRPINNWSVIYAQLCILFENRVNQEILKIHSY